MDDLERAMKSMKELGKGLEIITIGGKRMVQSVPLELSKDREFLDNPWLPLPLVNPTTHTSLLYG